MAKLLFLTFDLEEFDLPLDLCGITIEEKHMYEITRRGVEEVIEILDRTGVKSTFFTTASFGTRYPNLIKSLLKGGHEIAFHGYKHSQKYSKMGLRSAHEFIKKGKKMLEDVTGEKIIGFRSPWFFAPPAETLKKLGFEYDSSLHPTWVPGHYFNMRKPRSPYCKSGLKMLPISVTPLLRLPLSWLWFRNFGLTYAKVCTNLCMLDQPYVNIYLHPWEFVDLSTRNGCSKLPLIIRRKTGGEMSRMVESYLRWCCKSGLKLLPMTVKNGLKHLMINNANSHPHHDELSAAHLIHC